MPTKLKVGQKLTIPAGGTPRRRPALPSRPTPARGGETYTVKSGDTLTKIAKTHGTTVKAIEAANNLTTDHIKVGQKLNIPAKAEAAAPAPAPAPDAGRAANAARAGARSPHRPAKINAH